MIFLHWNRSMHILCSDGCYLALPQQTEGAKFYANPITAISYWLSSVACAWRNTFIVSGQVHCRLNSVISWWGLWWKNNTSLFTGTYIKDYLQQRCNSPSTALGWVWGLALLLFCHTRKSLLPHPSCLLWCHTSWTLSRRTYSMSQTNPWLEKCLFLRSAFQKHDAYLFGGCTVCKKIQ